MLHFITLLKFDYYHEDRTHLGLDKEPPLERPISSQSSSSAQLLELPRLGGLHHRYEWKEAARNLYDLLNARDNKIF